MTDGEPHAVHCRMANKVIADGRVMFGRPSPFISPCMVRLQGMSLHVPWLEGAQSCGTCETAVCRCSSLPVRRPIHPAQKRRALVSRADYHLFDTVIDCYRVRDGYN